MGKIVNSTYISLDGVVEKPHLWPSSGEDGGEGEAIQTELLLASDAVLMGRRTYEGFAPVWPTRSGDPASDKINSMPKYVVSTTLTDPDWTNTMVIDGDPVPELTRLRADNDLVQYGIGRLTLTLLQHGLLDELRLWIHPLFVGGATAEDLIYRHCLPTSFELADTRPLRNGIVVLMYHRTA